MYDKGIEIGIKKDFRNEVIARKIYLSFPTKIFVGKEEVQFDITNAIANHFKIPITAVQVVGSGKTGYSYYKNKEFIKGESDLDISIINKNLFIDYSETVLIETKGFKDLSNFGRTKAGDSKFGSYRNYINRG